MHASLVCVNRSTRACLLPSTIGRKRRLLLARAKKTFLATKEGPRVFAEAFKARMMMMIFAASKKDEKTTKRPSSSSSSKSLFPSVGVKLWESLKGTNGAGGGGDDEEERPRQTQKKQGDMTRPGEDTEDTRSKQRTVGTRHSMTGRLSPQQQLLC